MIENSFFKKYFMVDHLGLAHPFYASDANIACVSLDDNFKIKISSGRCRYLLPKCDFSKFAPEVRTRKFDEFSLDLLIESARHNKNFYYSFKDIYNHYIRYDLNIGHILIPRGDNDISEKIAKYAVLSDFVSVDETDLLTDIAIFLPTAEFVGVIAISSNSHSIGVFNSRAICILK